MSESVASISWNRVLVLLVVAVAGAWALYGATLDVPFFLDDLTYVGLMHPEGPLDTTRVSSLLWPSEAPFSFHDHFRPLGWASLLLDDLLWGCRPSTFRATGITWHALCAFLVGWFVARWRGREDFALALVAALLFVAYPAAFEPVIWVAHRFTLLATFGLLLGAHAVLSLVRRRRGVIWVSLAALFALLAKDSQLTIVLSLPVLALAAASRGERVRWGTATGVAVLVPVLLDLLLRRLCTGAWLPSLVGGGSVVDTLGTDRILEGLPDFFGAMAAPVVVHPDEQGLFSSGTLRLATLVMVCLAVAAGLLETIRRRAGAAPLLSWALAVLVLAFPVLMVGEGLSGSRRLHALAAPLLCWLAVAQPAPRWPLLALLIPVFAGGALRNAHVYEDARKLVTCAVDEAEQLARHGAPVLVIGLPASWHGTPLFGSGRHHFWIRFRPPLRDVALDVSACRSEDALRVIRKKETKPVWLAPLTLSEGRDPTLRLFPGDLLRFPSREEQVRATGVTIAEPPEDGFWPAGQSSVPVGFTCDGPVETTVWRLRISTEAQTADWVFRATGEPAITWQDQSGRLRLNDLKRPVLPTYGYLELLKQALGKGTPATMRLDRVHPVADGPGPGSTVRRFDLGWAR